MVGDLPKRKKPACVWKPDFCRERGSCQAGFRRCRKRVPTGEKSRERAPYVTQKVTIRELREREERERK